MIAEEQIITTDGTSIGIVLLIFSIFIVLFIWNIVVLIKKWKYLKQWAKIFYILLLFTGVGPVPSLVLLYAGVGVEEMIDNKL